ncbi:SusC/RagA family TonB-linked outer membrane protein [Carboxylicivirga sp. N1Y90]|uniref:SusC/RagA family TonB-linked outer membrane protein n=1 Tax=Carboxylicivirga fragile TaxID=3417571 RepID=UPI003D348C1A|nr:SusC/RagA family TonB-linked outer membrane protein [Marinilabiliaceae bacterium N1Y90]
MKRNENWFKRCLLFTAALIFGASLSFAQDLSIQGTVTSSDDGSAIPGVSVVQKGTTNGTITDIDGVYNLNVPQGAILVFSFVGMDTQEVSVTSATTYDVVMVPDVIGMDEVVVTALGISREKKALGYAVSELGGEELTTVKDPNVINSLSGKVAGVVITQSTSGPGGGSRVLIRGNNSLSGNNQPLYVVDGVPIDNSGAGSASGSGTGEYARADYGTGISDINPDDIESMTVLKGPNAAALYGSRAGNGVILITTKKGVSGKGLGVTVSSSYTFDNPLLLPQFQDQYGQGTQGNVPSDLDALKGSGSWGPKFDGTDQPYWTGINKAYSPQADNVKDFFDTGSQFINTIALEGGNEKANMRFSYTNNATKGILPNSQLDRHNFNLRSFANLTDRLSIDAKVTFFHQEMKNRAVQGTEGLLAYVYPMPRNMILDDYKVYQNPEESLNVLTYSNSGGNPYWILNHDQREDMRQRWSGFFKANYEFTDWLSAFVRVGTDMVSTKIETVDMPGHHFYNTGRFNFSTRKNSETNADFLFMINKDLTDDFSLNVNLGGNHSYRTYEMIGIAGENFKIPSKATVANAVKITPDYEPLQRKKVNSLYGSASLSFRDLAYLDVTARNDWSSTLNKDNWSYFYPSVSFSFLAHKVIPGIDGIVDMAKVRMSWAQVGNDTDPYQLYEYYNLAQEGYLGRTVVTRPSVRFNEDLRSESITSTEIGLEFSMLRNRLYGDFSWYNIKTEDLIFDVEVPASTGYSFFRENVGELKNSGIEFMIGGTPVKTGRFSWDIALNYAKNKNELVSLIEDTEVFIFSTTNSGDVVVQATVGGGYGDIYGKTFRRNDDGQLVVDAQGRPQASTENVHLGNYQPDWTGGLTNTITYSDFSLRFLIDGRFGGELYSGTDAALDGSGVSDRTLPFREGGITVDGVIDNGDGTFTQNTTNISAQDYYGALSGIVSEYVFDATNVRLRELSLTYRMPKSILGDGFVKGASLSLIGRNLFFIYKKMDNFDPESSFSTSNFSQGVLWYNLPTTRSLGFNLNVNF